MIMAATASFMLGRQGQTFFPSATQIACESPPSCRQLTDGELRFVQARLAGWPKQLQFRLSTFFSERSSVPARSAPSDY